MKRNRFYRIFAVLLLTCLLWLSVSCRGGEEQETGALTTESTTSLAETVETAETAETTETTVTEPPIPAVPTKGELCEVFNRQVLRLFSDAATGEGTEAEKMMEVMLPYLLGSGESTPTVDSYHVSNVTVTGDADVFSMPREIFYVDGVKTSEYEDAEIGIYREIEVIRDTGTVYLSTLDGDTTADGVSLNDDSSPLGDLKAETLTVIEQQLKDASEDSYTVANKYIRDVLNAVFGADIVTTWSNNSMSATLHFGEYRESGAMTMAIAVTDPAAIRIEIRLMGIGHDREGMELVLAVGEDTEIRMVGEMTDGSMSRMHMSVRMSEQTVEATQTVSGDHTELSMSTKSGGLVDLSYRMVLDMISETEGNGTVEATFRVGEEQSPGFTLLSAADSAVESVAKGTFAVHMIDGELEQLELEVAAVADTVTTDTRMFLTRSDVAVGESVMYYAIALCDSADPTINSSMEMEVKLTAVSGEVSTYALGMSATDSLGTSTVKATVTTADGVRPGYTAYEEKLIGRAKALLYDPEYFERDMQRAANDMMQMVTVDTIGAYPESFYITDTDGNGIVTVIHLVYDNGYYIYTDILLDVENYTYFYDGYDLYFNLVKRAGIRSVTDKLQMALTELPGYELRGDCNAIAYTYDETEQVYVLFDVSSGEHGYTWEEPVAEDYPGYALHAVVLGKNGTPIREIHDFEATYTALCYETLTCRDCQMMMVSYEPVHHIVTTKVICEAEGARPHTALAHCDRCGEAHRLILTDNSGAQMQVFLAHATPALLEEVQEYRTSPEELHPDISRTRDPETHYVITGLHTLASSFNADVIIPDLRKVTGDTIIGLGVIPQIDIATLSSKNPLKLVLPEGVEFIMSKQLISIFRYVSSLQLPSTLIHIDHVFEKSAIEELVIPASVKYVGERLVFPNLKKLTVEADLDTLPVIEAPKLQEILLLGKYRVIEGIRERAPIEELVLPEGVEEIGMSAFSHLPALKRVSLPESLTRISDHAFRGCAALEELVFPDTVTHIGTSAFAECGALAEVHLPSGLEKLSWGVFESAKSLKQIILPASVNYISEAVFRNCTSLENVEVLGELSYIGYDAFFNCPMLRDVPASAAN